MYFRLFTLFTLLSLDVFGQDIHFTRHEIHDLGKERIAGAALDGERLVTWGDRVLLWSLPDGDMQPLRARFPRPLGPGGVLFDVDGDGVADVVLNQAGGRRALFWINLRTGKSAEIDHGVAANEIVPATIHGHRGILLVQRRMQVRFYETPENPSKPWPSRDIYSFYSPSDQGGLLLADVNRDGRTDILSGNYWMECPEEFDLHWRLFAIRTWSEDKLSGMVQMALADLFGTGIPNLIVSQSEMTTARVAWFEKPTDPKELWTEHRLEGELYLNQPRSLQVADFNGNGRPDILVCERAGAGRLIVFSNENDGRFTPFEVGSTSGVVDARVMDWNGDGRPDVLVVERSSLSWWENR
jgi:FG-GAP-like repeat